MNYWKIGSKILILNGPKKGGAYKFERTVFEKGLSYSNYIGNVNWEGESEFVFHLEDTLTGRELDFSGYIFDLGQISVTEDGLESRIFKRVK